MGKQLLLLVCVLFFVSYLPAQDTDNSAVPSKQDVQRFMDLLQLRARMVQMEDGMKQAMKAGAEAGFKQDVPDATPEQLAKVDSIADVVFQDFPLDQMLDAIIPIYQKHLTKVDLDGIIAFYSSPTGQRLLKEQPAMMAEGMQAGQEIMIKKLPEMKRRLTAQVTQLAKAEKQHTAPRKTQPMSE